jgi:hypothetical protein
MVPLASENAVGIAFIRDFCILISRAFGFHQVATRRFISGSHINHHLSLQSFLKHFYRHQSLEQILQTIQRVAFMF